MPKKNQSNYNYVLAPDTFIGTMPVRQDITVLPADDPRRLRLGWVIFEEGFEIMFKPDTCSPLVLVVLSERGQRRHEVASLVPNEQYQIPTIMALGFQDVGVWLHGTCGWSSVETEDFSDIIPIGMNYGVFKRIVNCRNALRTITPHVQYVDKPLYEAVQRAVRQATPPTPVEQIMTKLDQAISRS